MKNKNIILTALIFIMGICLALPSFAQIYKEDIEETVQQFENNLDINIIPDNVSGQQLVSFLNVAVNKRNIAVVKEILGKGANLQGSEDIYYQDPLLIALANKCDDEEMLAADKEIMKLLVDNGADMTKPYLTPYQLYDFGIVAEYLYDIKNPIKEAKVRKND